MEGLYLLILAGLASGGIYACLAVALVMIYRATNEVNFAQGEMAMLSAYLCWACLDAGYSYIFSVAITLIASFAFGVFVQTFVMSRFQKSSHFVVLIAYLALFMIFNSIAGAAFGYTVKPFPSPFGGLALSSIGLSGHIVGSAATTLVVIFIVYGLFKFTKLGLAMRAAAIAPVTCRLAGIDVGLMLALGWGIAAVIGSVSAILAAPLFYLEPSMMLGVLLYAFAGGLLGGITNPWGAAVGAVMVGMAETLMGAYVVGTEIKTTIAFFLIILVLIVKPEGLFGHRFVARV
jgi:branched-chain amino acid transport system permease protein